MAEVFLKDLKESSTERV